MLPTCAPCSDDSALALENTARDRRALHTAFDWEMFEKEQLMIREKELDMELEVNHISIPCSRRNSNYDLAS